MQNKLVAIEPAVYALPMETLDVADNKITAVEPAVSHMSSLTNLFVQVMGLGYGLGLGLEAKGKSV